jgi:hypothetical protein
MIKAKNYLEKLLVYQDFFRMRALSVISNEHKYTKIIFWIIKVTNRVCFL